MDQEFANFVRQLFAVQSYPDLREYPAGPPEQPYDIAGWTLPFQMDVRVVAATSPIDVLRSKLEQVDGATSDDGTADASSFDNVLGVGFDSHPTAAGIVPPPGKITGSGATGSRDTVSFDMAQNNAYRALNRVWDAGGTVAFVPGTVGEGGHGGTSGRFVVSGADVETIVRDLAVHGERTNDKGRRLKRPRVGLYRPWAPSMDEGWTRWILERYEIAFENVYNAEMVAGDLRHRFDVLVLVDLSPRRIRQGYAKGRVPPRYAGGLGNEGARAIDAFVRAGGTLLALNSSTQWAIEELHLPVEDVVADLDSKEFFLGGSIVRMIVDPSQPVMTGMAHDASVLVAQSPVFGVGEEFEGAILAKYPAAGSPLLSGYLLGEEHVQGWASALDVRHGDGRVVLLGMRPQWRAQSLGTFRILFNALLFSSELAALAPDNEGFWEPPERDEDEEEE